MTLRLMLLGMFLLLSACSTPPPKGMREISMEELRDRIRGGWAGQMIGVSYGAPTEFRYLGRIIPESELPEWSEERLRNSIHQDDLYVEMTFARVMDERGIDASVEDYGAAFRESQYPLWHANLAARRALRRGIPAAESGSPVHNVHANDIDFQIESDFIGLMSPGLPASAVRLCSRVGRVMNSGDGIYGGMFVAGMYSAAFLESDPRKVVEAGYACLPPESEYARIIRDTLDWSAQYPDEWQRVWRLIQDRWDQHDPCPAGALRPFNIDAKLNGAYIALGLLYGRGDFEATMKISTRAGQDSDCNPSNAAGILGTMIGYEAIPERWKSGLDTIADEKFDYTDYSFTEIVESTVRRAVQMVSDRGGIVAEDALYLQVEEPEALEVSTWNDYGVPAERIGVTDRRWNWSRNWQSRRDGGEVVARETAQQGASAEVSFEGIGVILVGPYLPDGGRYDVLLDDVAVGTFDANSDEEAEKGMESLWHRFGLEPGAHRLRLEVRGEPYLEGGGSRVVVTDLVVFQ